MRFIPTSYHTCMQPPRAAGAPSGVPSSSSSFSLCVIVKVLCPERGGVGEAKKEVLYMHEDGKKGEARGKSQSRSLFSLPSAMYGTVYFFLFLSSQDDAASAAFAFTSPLCFPSPLLLPLFSCVRQSAPVSLPFSFLGPTEASGPPVLPFSPPPQ